MSVWARKICTLIEWGAVQERLADLQAATDTPRDLMMMVKSTLALGHYEIFLGLPAATWLEHFPGFERIGRDDIPGGLSLIICRQDGFTKRFPDIANKLARI